VTASSPQPHPAPPAEPGVARLPRLVRADEGAHPVPAPCAPSCAGPARDPVSAWLDVLTSLLDLPTADRASIRDELDEHLRERVRDLILSGKPDADATSAAIAELGDAAALARRYRHATHAPRRRFVMNSAIFALAGTALITSLVALRGGDGQQAATSSVFQPPAAASPVRDVRVSCAAGTTWGQLLTAIGENAKKPAFVYWNHLADLRAGDTPVEQNSPVTGIAFRDLALHRALALINESLSPGGDNGLDVREQDGVLVFSTVEHLDKLELTLATFDLSGLVAARRASLDQPNYPPDKVLEEATGVIQSLVHSELWQNNGGDRAQISSFDSRLFIKAPRRIMPQVEWVIGELIKGGAVADAGPSAATYVFSLGATQAIDAQRTLLDRHQARIGHARIIADPSSNSLVVTCTRKEHESISAILNELDQRPARPADPVTGNLPVVRFEPAR
jgi:hypothetical protein